MRLTDGTYPISREREGGTRRGRICEVVLTEWNIVEHSGSITENERMGPVGNHTTESSRKKIKGGGEQARDPNSATQHQIGAGGGFVGCDTRTTARQYCYQSPVVDKSDQGDPHAIYFRIQCMGGRVVEQSPGQYWHHLERIIRMSG